MWGSSGNAGQVMRRPGPRQSFDYGHGAVQPQANSTVFTELVNMWSRVASFLTPWCAEGEVPLRVNLNLIVSMSLGHSVLFKLRRRRLENTHTQIRMVHGDPLVMDGLTQIGVRAL